MCIDLNLEEIQFLMDNPEEIETGCENNCDECKEVEMKRLKAVLKDRFNESNS